jgi:hypothetical protein
MPSSASRWLIALIACLLVFTARSMLAQQSEDPAPAQPNGQAALDTVKFVAGGAVGLVTRAGICASLPSSTRSPVSQACTSDRPVVSHLASQRSLAAPGVHDFVGRFLDSGSHRRMDADATAVTARRARGGREGIALLDAYRYFNRGRSGRRGRRELSKWGLGFSC